jgi:hypothetical protein
MSAKGSRSVMILSVDVVRDSAAHSYKLCTGRNWKKPSPRNKHLKNRRQAHATFRDEYASRWIKAKEVRERGRINKSVAVIDAAIAVAPAQTKRQNGSVILWERKTISWRVRS